ncbi:MAG: flavodoxin [Anaerobiospirillum sp.]|nr:flavodoxin [Anaerobiospirillum sp.]
MAVPTPVTTALALVLGCFGLIGGNVTLANTSLDLSKVELHQPSTQDAPATPSSNQGAPSAETSAAPQAEAPASSSTPASTTTSPSAQVQPGAQDSAPLASTTSSAANSSASSAASSSASSAVSSSANSGSLVRERPRYRDPFGNRITAPLSTVRNQKEEVSGSSYGVSQHGQDQAQINFPKTDLAHSKVAVIYFSVSENLASNDVDELTGASIIYNHNHERRGITEYVAELIAQATHAQTYLISRLSPYSHEHDELIYQASLELDERTHPEIVMLPPLDLKAYDVIFIGYPIWWYELPMPLYTFFEQYDLSGKIVIPFCTHGGSRAYKTFALIAQQEPNAYVLYNDGLIIDRLVVPTHATSTISLWLQALNERLSHKLGTPVGFDLDRHSPILEPNAAAHGSSAAQSSNAALGISATQSSSAAQGSTVPQGSSAARSTPEATNAAPTSSSS